MAQNLRRKLPPSDTLIVYDVRKDIVDRFTTEEKEEGRGSKVEGAKGLEEVVDKAVSNMISKRVVGRFYDEKRKTVIPGTFVLGE